MTENKEGFLVQGKTQEEKDQQTRFRIYKTVLDSGERMKADIGEHPCILIPGAFTNMDGGTLGFARAKGLIRGLNRYPNPSRIVATAMYYLT
jgi:hypothetical protein